MLPESSICIGTLRHRRFRPTQHEFTYPVFQVFLDIERIPELMGASPLASYNRWNLVSFDDRDHFGDLRRPLRERLGDDAAAHGLTLPDGPVYLLTNLRYLGYCFNPVSFFYCYNQAGQLQVILAEVNNTFGESENYWLSAANEWPAANARRYQCGKRLHVSPFMPMEMEYTFVLTEPDTRRLVVHMDVLKSGQAAFDATLKLRCEPWSDGALHRALVRYPFMTAKVIAAIHWEAARLWWKRTPFYSNPGRLQETQKKSEVKHVEA